MKEEKILHLNFIVTLELERTGDAFSCRTPQMQPTHLKDSKENSVLISKTKVQVSLKIMQHLFIELFRRVPANCCF